VPSPGVELTVESSFATARLPRSVEARHAIGKGSVSAMQLASSGICRLIDSLIRASAPSTASP
jgi:hypothetical protein